MLHVAACPPDRSHLGRQKRRAREYPLGSIGWTKGRLSLPLDGQRARSGHADSRARAIDPARAARAQSRAQSDARRDVSTFLFDTLITVAASTCATLETGEILRSGFHGQIAKMTGTTHLTGVDLKTSLISKPVTLEIREIRVSTVAWEVQPRLNFLSQIQPRLNFPSQPSLQSARSSPPRTFGPAAWVRSGIQPCGSSSRND
eukprot:COSAG02_NODE_10841_length_1847_cov_11.980549_2_plen_203_part_00